MTIPSTRKGLLALLGSAGVVLVAACATGGDDDGLPGPVDGGVRVFGAADATAGRGPARGGDGARGHDGDAPDATVEGDAGPATGVEERDGDAGPGPDAGVVDAGASADAGGAVDAGAVDAGVVDAGPGSDAGVVDAGTSADAGDAGDAPEGAACATDQDVETRRCGACGTASRLCAAGGGGGPTWRAWGACLGEIQGACVPGTTKESPCGRCGIRTQICQDDCSWASSSCHQPAAAECDPGADEYVEGLSCPVGGRVRTCGAACVFGDFGPCFDPSAPVDGGVSSAVAVPRSASPGANVVTTIRSFSATRAMVRMTGSCPEASPSTSASPSSYDFVIVTNADPIRAARVSAWTHAAPGGGGNLDTVTAGYVGRDAAPSTPAELAACTAGVVDRCQARGAAEPTMCAADWGGLVVNPGDPASGLTLAPSTSAVVYVGLYSGTRDGAYAFSVRTESLR